MRNCRQLRQAAHAAEAAARAAEEAAKKAALERIIAAGPPRGSRISPRRGRIGTATAGSNALAISAARAATARAGSVRPPAKP